MRLSGIRYKTVRLVFVLKVAAGFALWAIYTFHYSYRETSDAFRYFDDAMVLFNTLKDSPTIYFQFLFGIGLDDPALTPIFDQLRGWSSSYSYGIANDNPTIIRLNMLIALFSQGFYHVHTVVFGFLSTVGVMAFVRGAYALGNISFHKTLAFLSVALMPTVLFWGSGVLKEAPLIAGIGMFLWSLTNLLKKQWRFVFWTALSVLFLANLKPYVLITMLPAVIAFLLGKVVLKQRLVWLRYTLVVVVSYVGAVFAARVYSPGGMLYILAKKQQDFYNVATANNAGSTVEIAPVDQSFFGFLMDVPERLWLAFMRPTLSEVEGAFYWPPMLESSMLFILFVVVIFRFRIVRKELLTNELFCFSLTFIIVLGTVIGSCVPVLGAVVRYRLPGVLFAALLVPLTLFVYPVLNRWIADRF